jgi:hypothetical protein
MVREANERALSPSSHAKALHGAARPAPGHCNKRQRNCLPDKSADVKNVTQALHLRWLQGFSVAMRDPRAYGFDIKEKLLWGWSICV